MFRYLERLRRKPRAARMRIGFLFAAGVTVLVVLIWMLSLPSRLGSFGSATSGDGELNSLFGETASSVRDVVKGAEVFGGRAPSGTENTGAVQNAIQGTSSRSTSTPRQVLIATSTSETGVGAPTERE